MLEGTQVVQENLVGPLEILLGHGGRVDLFPKRPPGRPGVGDPNSFPVHAD